MTKTLRAADLGYVWPESIPDGRTWVKRRGLPILCENRPTWEPARDWTIDGRVWSADECELLGIPIPDFSNLPWTECILVKGDEPPKPKLRPYNAEEMAALVGTPLRHKSGVVAAVMRYRPDYDDVLMGDSSLCNWYSGGLLGDWTHLDGRPCGEEVTDG